jgi:hypothetical protein
MSKSINIESFSFPGFSGVESQCSIRLLFPENQKDSIVVACTQKRDYTGTSITNGFEMILQKLCSEGLSGVHGAEFKQLLTKITAQESSFLKIFKALVRKNKKSSFDYYGLFEKNILIWLEIYPPGTGIVDDRITIQRVYITEDGSPVWSNLLTEEYLKEKVGVEYKEVVKHAL